MTETRTRKIRHEMPVKRTRTEKRGERGRDREEETRRKTEREVATKGKSRGGFDRVVGYSETHGDPLTSSFLSFLFISVPYLTDPHQL